MKYLPYILKHLRRNWIRTASTVVAMAVCIFLFCTLQSVLAAVDALLEAHQRQAPRHAPRGEPRLRPSPRLREPDPVGARREAGGDQQLVRRLLPAKKEGKAEDAERRGVLHHGLEQLLHEHGGRGGALLRDVPGVPAAPRPVPGVPAGPAWAASSAASSRTSSAGRWGTRSTWRASSPPYRKPDGPFEFVVRAIFDADPQAPQRRHERHVLPLQVPLRGQRANG